MIQAGVEGGSPTSVEDSASDTEATESIEVKKRRSSLDVTDPWFLPFVFCFWSAEVFLGWLYEYSSSRVLEGWLGNSLHAVFWFAVGAAISQLFMLCLSFSYSRTRLAHRIIWLFWVLVSGALLWFFAAGGMRNAWTDWSSLADRGSQLYLRVLFRGMGHNLNDHPLLTACSFFCFTLLFSWLLNSLIFGVRFFHPWQKCVVQEDELARCHRATLRHKLAGLAVLVISFLFLTSPSTIFFEELPGDFALLAFLLSMLYGVVFFLAALIRVRLLEVLLLVPIPAAVYGILVGNRELFGRSDHDEHLYLFYGFISVHLLFVGLLWMTWSLPRRLPNASDSVKTELEFPKRSRWSDWFGFLFPFRYVSASIFALLLVVANFLPLVFDVPIYIATDRSFGAATVVAKARLYNGQSFFAPSEYSDMQERSLFYYWGRTPVLIVSENLRRSSGGNYFEQDTIDAGISVDRRYRVASAELLASSIQSVYIDGSRLLPESLSEVWVRSRLTYIDLADAEVNQDWLEFLRPLKARLVFRRCKFEVPLFKTLRGFGIIEIRETVLTEQVLACLDKGDKGGEVVVWIDSADQLQCSFRSVDMCSIRILGDKQKIKAITSKAWPDEEIAIRKGDGFYQVVRKTW